VAGRAGFGGQLLVPVTRRAVRAVRKQRAKPRCFTRREPCSCSPYAAEPARLSLSAVQLDGCYGAAQGSDSVFVGSALPCAAHPSATSHTERRKELADDFPRACPSVLTARPWGTLKVRRKRSPPERSPPLLHSAACSVVRLTQEKMKLNFNHTRLRWYVRVFTKMQVVG